MSDRLLVAYGTTNDATRRVAEVIADQLRIDGLTVDVAPASDIHAVNGYDAVVLGGAVFHAHWHDDSRRFARRHASALNDRPVWVFSAVSDGDAPSPTPVRGALQAMVRLHARGHASFSTAVQPMRAWADSIARALSASPTATSHYGDQVLTVGFDLDMTLVDSRAGIRACLEALADETDRTIDADAIVAQLGPPIRRALADAFAEHELDDAVRRFRVHMASFGAAMATPMPGAGDAIASVQSLGGRVLVVTAKHQPLAEVTMTATRLATDALVGDLWGVDKALALREWSAQIYVGDHWADVHAARAADATSVVVLTGGIDRRSLEDASPDAILTDLGEFPDWLAQRYVRRR